MARAVGGVGGDAAPDATAAAATNASGLGLAPVASERDAGGRTVPLPVARQWLPADPASETRQAVVGPSRTVGRWAPRAGLGGRGIEGRHGAGP